MTRVDRRALAGPLGAAALSLALGSIALGRTSLWVDESFTARATSKSYGALIHEDHWLYYTLVKTWTELAGRSEWALRFPSVVAAAAAAGLLVVLGTRLAGRRTGVLAGVLLAVNPFVVVWAQQARSYTFLVLIAVAATLALVGALETPTIRRWVVYGGLVGLILVWQPIGALVVPAHLAGVLLHRPRPRLALVAGVYVAVAALVTPWIVAVGSREARGGPTTWLDDPGLKDVLVAALWISGPLLVGVALAAAGAIAAVQERAAWIAGLLLAWTTLPFLLAFAASLVKPVFLDRYLITAAPAFALLGAIALAHVRPRAALAAGALLVIAASAQLGTWYVHTTDTDWRAATAYVEDVHGASPVLVAPSWAGPAYAYYAGAQPAGVAEGRSVWVIALGQDERELADEARLVLPASRYSLASVRHFGSHLAAQHWVAQAR